MGRSANSFNRPSARFKPQARVLILCEDTKSGKTYLENASKHYRSFASVEFAHCGHTDPKGIVAEAVGRERDFEEIYCVLDRDSHAGWTEALSAALASQKVRVIPSYPSFEYWILIHFLFTRAPQNSAGGLSASDRIVRELKNQPGMNQYAKSYKGNLFSDLLQRLPVAIQNSQRGLIEADQTNEPNPSTLIHELLARLEALSSPIAI